MQNLKRPKDYGERRKAELCFTSNIVIEAGAGMGKTTSLIKRLCYLILAEQIAPQNIVAVSFTDKASGELKTKLINALTNAQNALAGQNTDDEITLTVLNILREKNPDKDENALKEIMRKTLQDAFDNIERAQISTIHSFCLKILRTYPLEAGVPPSCRVSSDGARQNIFDKHWAYFLENEFAQNAENAQTWKDLLKEIPLEDLKDFAFTLTLPFMEGYRPSANCKAQSAQLEQIAKQALELASRYPILRGKTRKAENAMLQAHKDLTAAAQSGPATEPAPQTQEEELEDIGTCPSNWEESAFAQAKNIFELSQNLKPKNRALILKAYLALKPFAENFKTALRKENMLSYDEIIYKTKNLVEKNRLVRNELKEAYKSFLIDEFQDTDPAQGEIMLFLCEKANSFASSWQDICFEEGKLCVVGDPKQSIYRFRGADICAYEQFTDKLLKDGAQKAQYTSNFRSTPQIIDFVNAFGQKAIAEIKNIQPRYLPLASEADFNGPAPQIIAFAKTAEEEENPAAKPAKEKNAEADAKALRHNQAQYIAKWIEENAAKTTLQNGRKMSYKDITLLLRNQTALNIYTDALKRFNIPYSVEETKNFFLAQEILDLINILQAVNDTRDKTALLGVLRSPFGLLKDEEILAISQNNALNIFADNLPADAGRAKEIYRTLRELYQKAGKISVESLVKEIIFERNFLSFQTLANPKAQTAANILKFIDLAREICQSGALTLNQFLFFLNKYSKEEGGEGESPLAEDNLDTVRIMTIHKAKGLEAPVIIAADLSAQSAQKDRPFYLLGWRDNIRGARCGKFFDAEYSLLQYLNREHKTAEELRLLYVALSRPREFLVLTGNLESAQSSLAGALAQSGLWPQKQDCSEISASGARAQVLCPQFVNPQRFINDYGHGAQQRAAAPDVTAWLAKYGQRRENYLSAINKDGPKAPSAAASFDAPKDARAALKNEEAKLTGTLCHEILLNKFAPARAGQSGQNIGFYEEKLLKSAQQSAQAICAAFFESPAFKTLLDMEFLYGELPFAYKDKDGQIINGVIDAVFKTKQGAIFIADYKSDKIDIRELDAYSQKYTAQVKIYKLALKELFRNTEIKTALVYLRAGAICEIA